MRKLITSFDTIGIAVPLPSLPPSPLFSPQDLPDNSVFFFPSEPVVDTAFDFTTFSLVSGLLLLSLLSICFIFHLRIKSRLSYHLQNFSSVWTVRLLLVFFIALWALNEIPRLPFFHRSYLYPFLPSLTPNQQTSLCKVHVALSLGFFEPGFLFTLLYLVNISIKKVNPCHKWAAVSVCISCIPISLLQVFLVFFTPMKTNLPEAIHRSSVIILNLHDERSVVCTYPLSNTILFALFVITFSLGFLLSCWKVLSLVINKGIRVRINILIFAVTIALPLQIIFLSMTSFWTPASYYYSLTAFAAFLCMVVCTSVGEGVFVIKPISEALAAGGENHLRNCRSRSHLDVERRIREENGGR